MYRLYRYKVVAGILFSVVLLGCPGTQTTLNVVVAALNSGAAVLKASNPSVSADLSVAATDVQTLSVLFSQYQSALPADRATSADKVRVASQVLINNLTNILSIVHVSGSEYETVVVASVTVANTLIQGFLEQLPTPSPGIQPRTATTKVSPPLPTTSPKDLKGWFNSQVKSAGHPEAQIR